jgi:hypothetical protein
MRTFATVLCLAAIAANAAPAHAQVTLDMAKVTCDQWSGYKITNPQNIALWLKLRDFCITNPQLPVMQAVEKVFTQ